MLIAEDDALVAGAMERLLRRRGYPVQVVNDGASAIRLLEESYFDILLLDLGLPEVDGWGVLARARDLAEPPVTLVMTGVGDTKTAVQAMRCGASDFVTKPIDVADLQIRLENLLDTATIKRRLAALEAQAASGPAPVAVSLAMKTAFGLADRVAATPSSSALILGESGVGKEVVAARIHERSARRDGPFVRVNLAAIPENMIEAELFGSVRGAYTDSKRDRTGLFASADGGTLLLDELCEFRVDLQPKLLRVLEERRFFPVGSDRERRVDIRVIAATNREPGAAIASGRLREDLFYRLATVCIEVPPLRDRTEDVLPLARHFLSYFAQEFGRDAPVFSLEAETTLLAHSWPGNVRELRNAIERALMMTPGREIAASALGLGLPSSRSLPTAPSTAEVPPPASTDQPAEPLRSATSRAVGALERESIARVLKLVNGSRTRAAVVLGVSRTTLWEKMKRYGL